jgi:S1-C subfamily serine protease
MDQFGVRKPELRKIARTPKLPEVKAIGAPPVVAAEAPKSDDVRYWQGARIRDIGGQEYSAFGVAKDSGGVHLQAVPLGSAAARDGFMTDDLLQSLNGKAVKCVADLLKLQNGAAGQPMKIGLVRGQQAQAVRVER